MNIHINTTNIPIFSYHLYTCECIIYKCILSYALIEEKKGMQYICFELIDLLSKK